jgi:hypothetical protein
MTDINDNEDLDVPLDPIDPMDPIAPEDVDSPSISAADGAGETTAGGPPDPNDEIPVPIAMWPSEIDERAQVVEALRGKGPPPRTDTQVDPTNPA